MARFLKQSTAVTAVIGPAINLSGIGYLSAQSAVVNISKANGAFGARNSTASASAHDASGWYRFPLDATDTNTLGALVIIMVDSASQLQVWHEYNVLAANVFDSLIGGGDTLDVAIPIGAFAASSISAAAFSNSSITSGILADNAIGIGKVAASALSAAAFSNNTITSGIMAASAIGASQLAQNAIGSVQLSAGAISIGKFAASALSAAVFSSNSIVGDTISASAFTNAKFAANVFTSMWAVNCSEPTGVVSASATVLQAMSWMNTITRNKITQTSAAISIRNDADDATIASASVSDASSTFTRGEFV